MPVKHLFLEEQKQNGINILKPDMILWSKIFHICPKKNLCEPKQGGPHKKD